MSEKPPKFTRKELEYIRVILIKHRNIQSIVGKKQDKEYAPIMNKLTDYLKTLDGK